jgi:hypothetical protein
MCSKSSPLVVFALDLMSTYEGEHTIFGLLGQAKKCISWSFMYLWRNAVQSFAQSGRDLPSNHQDLSSGPNTLTLLPIFKLFCLLLLSFRSFLCVLDINPLLDK